MKQTIVIKIGGKLLVEKKTRKMLLAKILSLLDKYYVVVVHGGKFQINKDLGTVSSGVKEKPPIFIKGQRFTDETTLKQVTETLSRINKEIVKEFNAIKKSKAVGISGVDAGFINVDRMKILGYVGKIKSVNSKLIELLIKNGYIPVIFPICANKDTVLNVNADNVASSVAIGLKADKLVFMSDVPGVMDITGKIIPKIDFQAAQTLKKKNIIKEGMIPKTDGCFSAIKKGVKEIYITNTLKVGKDKFFPSGTCISN